LGFLLYAMFSAVSMLYVRLFVSCCPFVFRGGLSGIVFVSVWWWWWYYKMLTCGFMFITVLCEWVCIVLTSKVLKDSYVRTVDGFTHYKTFMLSFITTVKLQLLYSVLLTWYPVRSLTLYDGIILCWTIPSQLWYTLKPKYSLSVVFAFKFIPYKRQIWYTWSYV
jgi:hypothetical protein